MDRGQVHQFSDVGGLGTFEDAGFEGRDGTNAKVQGLGDLVCPPAFEQIVEDVDLTGWHTCEWYEGILFGRAFPGEDAGDADLVVEEFAEQGHHFDLGDGFGDDIADAIAQECAFIDTGGPAGEDHDLEIGVEVADGGDHFEGAAIGEHDIEDEVGEVGAAQLFHELAAGGGFVDEIFIDMMFYEKPESFAGHGVVFGHQYLPVHGLFDDFYWLDYLSGHFITTVWLRLFDGLAW